jgi:hypothetical protein
MNCRFRIRCANSIPASVMAAFRNDLKPGHPGAPTFDRTMILLDDVVEVPRAMSLATPRALEDLRPFVLGNHALELNQQFVFRRRIRLAATVSSACMFLDATKDRRGCQSPIS